MHVCKKLKTLFKKTSEIHNIVPMFLDNDLGQGGLLPSKGFDQLWRVFENVALAAADTTGLESSLCMQRQAGSATIL